jgi:glutathione S-transferase
MLAHMQVPFEDRQYQVGAHPTYDKSVWAAARAELVSAGAWAPNLPYLIDTSSPVPLTETHTIMRHLAVTRPEHQLMGRSVLETVKADQLSEVLHDCMAGLTNTTYTSWFAFAPAREKWLSSSLPNQMSLLEACCSSSAGSAESSWWAAGPNLTYADFILYEFLAQAVAFAGRAAMFGADGAAFPHLAALMDKFEALPNVAAYVESKAFLAQPYHNIYSHFVDWHDGVPLLGGGDCQVADMQSSVVTKFWPPKAPQSSADTVNRSVS